MTTVTLPVLSQQTSLSPLEQSEYERYLASGKPPLSPRTAAELLALYLQGYNTQELAQEYPNLGMGIIVRAKVDYDWDGFKQRYIMGLMGQVEESVRKSQLEAIRFASDGMAVYHKLIGGRFRAFLRSGDPEDLGEFKDMSIKTYREFVGLMTQLTGQDDKKTTKLGGEIVHRHEVSPDSTEKAIDATGLTGKALLEYIAGSGGI
jgi:hypothetical protein